MTRTRRSARVALVLGFLAVALQRFGITNPDGSALNFTALVLVIIVLWQLFSSKARIEPVGVALFILLAVAASLALILAPNPTYVSSTSFLLFLATYSLVLVRGRTPKGTDGSIGVGQMVFSGAAAAAKFGSLLAILQFVIQRLGAGFFDPLQSFPPQFLISGFNTYWSLRYQGGVGEYKPNGVIFLEPSLLSLYSVLGLIFVLGRLFGKIEGGSRRSNVFWAVVLAGGLAVSASSSGILVLAIAAAPMILSIRRNRALVIALFVALLAALTAGAFNSVIEKANEGFTGRTSSALRLTLPYEVLAPAWQQQPWLGWGPGAAVKFIERANILGLQASTLMKLLVEYGLIGALVLTAVVAYCLWRSGAPLYVSFGIFAAWLLPAEALLNSTLVLLMLFCLPHWRTRGVDEHGSSIAPVSSQSSALRPRPARPRVGPTYPAG